MLASSYLLQRFFLPACIFFFKSSCRIVSYLWLMASNSMTKFKNSVYLSFSLLLVYKYKNIYYVDLKVILK